MPCQVVPIGVSKIKTSWLLVFFIMVIGSLQTFAGRNDSDWVQLGIFRPASLPHANLPRKGLIRVGASLQISNVNPNDFYKNHQVDSIHFNHTAGKNTTIFSLFYGITNNMVFIAKIPIVSAFTKGTIHPAGAQDLTLHTDGSIHSLGDISMIVKNRWITQGTNSKFSFATIIGGSLPTGSNKGKFNNPLVLENKTSGTNIIGVENAPHPRFNNDGRLPSSLQSGTGAFVAKGGFVFTKIFYNYPGAVHIGAIGILRGHADEVDFGNQINYFADFFKTIYKHKLIAELAFNGSYKEDDKYSGIFTHPTVDNNGKITGFATTTRPAFKGGTSIRLTPSILYSPAKGFRLTLTYSRLLNHPRLGPWAKNSYQMGFTYEF